MLKYQSGHSRSENVVVNDEKEIQVQEISVSVHNIENEVQHVCMPGG